MVRLVPEEGGDVDATQRVLLEPGSQLLGRE